MSEQTETTTPETAETTKPKRITVQLEDFLRVTVAEREQFDSIEKAASALGMTEGSFKQRLTRERKEYPSIFKSVPKYTGKNGPKRATEAEAQAILAKLTASSESESGEAANG